MRMLQVPLAEPCPHQGQHPRRARGIKGVCALFAATCQGLLGPLHSTVTQMDQQKQRKEDGNTHRFTYVCLQGCGAWEPAQRLQQESGVGQPGPASWFLYLQVI